MPMEVRALRPEEYEEAGRVTALAYQEFAVPGDPGWEEYLERIADVAARAARAVALGAIEEGRVLGSVTVELDQRIEGGDTRSELRPEEAHVRMLGVHPGHRRRGIGRLLTEACTEVARDAGKRVISLETAETMTAAQRMYESMGFRRGEDLVFENDFRLLSYELSL